MGPLLALLLTAAPAWSALDAPGRAAALEALRAEAMPARVARAADRFLGTRYQLSPLGEGAGRDPDPLLRLDAVDCLTLVEQSLALARAPDEAQVLPTLSGLRYAGAPAWEHRHHLMEAQWLPAQVAGGVLKDVTRQWGGAATRREIKTLTAATWREASARALALDETAQPRGEFGLELIPVANAAAALARAPEGLVVVVARADRPRLVTRVSHVAILVQGPRGPALRHASRTFGRVVDEPLSRYLARNLAWGTWTIEGLALFEPLEPRSPRP